MKAIQTWEDARESFRELLDSYGEVSVAGYTWDASRVLEELDPVAFRQELLGYLDSLGIDTDLLEGE